MFRPALYENCSEISDFIYIKLTRIDWLVLVRPIRADWCMHSCLINTNACTRLHSWACVSVFLFTWEAAATWWCEPWRCRRQQEETEGGDLTKIVGTLWKKLLIQVGFATGSVLSDGGLWSIQCISGCLEYKKKPHSALSEERAFFSRWWNSYFSFFFFNLSASEFLCTVSQNKS